jgi:hypothetical protein
VNPLQKAGSVRENAGPDAAGQVACQRKKDFRHSRALYAERKRNAAAAVVMAQA